MPACSANIFSRSKTKDIFQLIDAIFMYVYKNIVCVSMYICIHPLYFYDYMNEVFVCGSSWCAVINCSPASDSLEYLHLWSWKVLVLVLFEISLGRNNLSMDYLILTLPWYSQFNRQSFIQAAVLPFTRLDMLHTYDSVLF